MKNKWFAYAWLTYVLIITSQLLIKNAKTSVLNWITANVLNTCIAQKHKRNAAAWWIYIVPFFNQSEIIPCLRDTRCQITLVLEMEVRDSVYHHFHQPSQQSHEWVDETLDNIQSITQSLLAIIEYHDVDLFVQSAISYWWASS